MTGFAKNYGLEAGLLALALCSSACGSDAAGGPELVELRTVALDAVGHRSDSRCTVVPVLLGGRVRDEIDVAGEFTIIVDATHQEISVSFRGVTDAEALTRDIDVTSVDATFVELIDVETLRQRHFVVELSGGCAP